MLRHNKHPVADLELALTNNGRTAASQHVLGGKTDIADIADPQFPQE